MNSVVACCIIFLLIWSVSTTTVSCTSLTVGFYDNCCPAAEAMVREAVNEAVFHNPGIAAGLIRMHFHDCFVRGCDASVLLESTPGNPSERDNSINNHSLRGFEVIDKAKLKIEATCPNTVSCADILAFAARDSSCTLGGINYVVPAGRRDGIISNMSEVNSLPAPFHNAEQITKKFTQKGLSIDEMVTLSGAHSIGLAHCSSFAKRLYNFSATHSQDPSLDPKYAAFLKTKCPPTLTNGYGDNPTVQLEPFTPLRLDNWYYITLKNHCGLFTSDQTLLSSPLTHNMVMDNANDGATWTAKFAEAMVHLGSIDVLTGTQGQIRTKCSVVN